MRCAKSASIFISLLLIAAAAFAAPGPFTVSGSAFCFDHSTNRPGIRLTWPASAGATGYDVYRQGNAVPVASLPTGGSYTFETSDNSMSAGQTISYFVVAKDNAGGTYTSNTVDVFISGGVCQPAPAAPVLDGSAACDTSVPRAIVNLTWSGSPTAVSYQIFRNNSPLTSTTDTAYTDTTVSPGGPYTYKVTASNSGGSTDSNTKTLNVPEAVCPPGPLTATASAFCGAGPPVAPAVHVEWSASAFAASYVVKRDGTPVSGTLSSSTTSFDDFSGVSTGQTYNYTVTATNPSGTATSPPAAVSITGLGCTSPPPGAFAASVSQLCNLGAPAAHVTWNASSFASSYFVNRNGSPITGTLSSGTTSYDDANVTAGQSYTYTVTATSGSGSTTSTSATLNVESCGGGNGNAPSPFTAAVSAFCNAGSPAVHVTWAAGSGATSYVVNRNGVQISGTLSSVTTSFDDTAVTAGQSYTYSVVGSNAGGSTAAPDVTIVPSATVCPPPAFTLTAQATCNPIVSPPAAMVTLNWSAAATATSYIIFRNGTQLASVGGGTTTFNDAGATSPQTYTYVVRAVGPGGNTDSNSANATVEANMCSTPKPDLAAVAVSIALPAGQPGDEMAAAINVANQGSASANATTSRLRIGSGTTLSPSDPIVATIATPPLGAGANITQTTTFTVPNLSSGTYFLFLSVDDDHVSGDINPANDVKRSFGFAVQGPGCPLSCAASVPSSAQAATPVAFALQQAPTCATVSAVWNFGDNTATTQIAPTHTYAATGIYHWTVTLITPSGETCSISGNITITTPTAPPKRRAVRH